MSEDKRSNNDPRKTLNDTAYNVPFKSAVERFEEQVGLSGDRTAVAAKHISFSYSELDEYTNRIANALMLLGVKRDDTVVLLLDRNIMYYFANLGVLKSGAAFIPVSTSYPYERIDSIYNDSECRFLITSRRIFEKRRSLLEPISGRVLFLGDLMFSPSGERPGVPTDENDLAYLIYTSGSTGKPKGVMIEHGNLSNFLDPNPLNLEIRRIVENGAVQLALAAFTFDVSIMEQFIALTSGMTLVLASDDEIMNPAGLKELMDAWHVDSMFTTPSFLNTLLMIPSMSEALGRIRVFDLGAEAFPDELYNRIRSVNSGGVIINGYGPTEATISCIAKEITDDGRVTIGRPATNVFCHIIDDEENEVPAGSIGELLICGKGVGRGYRNLPEETARAFITYDGMRAYKSGDLARIDENGEIEFHGRKDYQVKLRGLRIELGEIENVMNSCPGIDVCAAAAIDGKLLCLYYTVKQGEGGDDQVTSFRAFAREHLAHYMQPERYIQLDKMPYSANWKIDRKALPKPENIQTDAKAPENAMQAKLVDIFSDILKNDCIGTDTVLADVGLTSLHLILAASMIGESYDIILNIPELKQCSTILQLEQLILNKPKTTGAEDVYDAPALWTQKLYYTLPRISTLTECVMAVSVMLDKDIDTERLKTAIRSAVRLHPGLLVRFEMRDGELHLIYPTEEDIKRETDRFPIDVIASDDAEIEAAIASLCTDLLEPEAYPAFSFAIYETASAKYLTMRIDHSLGDGEAVSLLTEHIFKLYDGESVAPEIMNIAQYAADLAEKRNKGENKEAIDYYKGLLQDISSRPAFKQEESQSGKREEVFIGNLSASAEECSTAAKALGVSEHVFFAAATLLMLARHTKSRRIPLVIPCSGREDYRISETFGMVLHNTMICPDIDPGMTVADFMRSVEEQCYKSMSFAEFPADELSAFYPEILDRLFIYQGDSASHTVAGKTVYEEWLEDTEDDDDPIETKLRPSSDIGSYPIPEAAKRWILCQTCFEVFRDDDGILFILDAKVSDEDREVMNEMVSDFDGICSAICSGGKDMKLESINGISFSGKCPLNV